MESSAKFLGHPIHQMLVVLPAGLLITAAVFEVVHIANGNALMAMVSFHLIASGIVGGLLAAPFGFIDWIKVPVGTRARRIGALHGLGNVAVLVLAAVGLLLRWEAPGDPSGVSHGLIFAAVALLLVTAWLGGELVDRLGVGICDEVGLDAPSSLRGRRERSGARQAH